MNLSRTVSVTSKVHDILRLRDQFLARLVEAQEQRNKREVEDWIFFERETMFRAVNEERIKMGQPPIELADVERVERMACGHSDYSRKFALYCVELVYGPRVPNIQP